MSQDNAKIRITEGLTMDYPLKLTMTDKERVGEQAVRQPQPIVTVKSKKYVVGDITSLL